MAPYSLVPPHEYSEQHTLFINQVTQGIKLLSPTSHVIMGLKDINCGKNIFYDHIK